jgi:hypothetical protein
MPAGALAKEWQGGNKKIHTPKSPLVEGTSAFADSNPPLFSEGDIGGVYIRPNKL